MRRLIIRPGAIGDCILAMPAIEHLADHFTELWIPTAVTPLCAHLGQVVCPLASTGIDLVGVGDLETPEVLAATLRSFDSIVSWYGANRPEFRDALLRTGTSCEFHAALPPAGYAGHATDFFLEQVGGLPGGIPCLDMSGLNVNNEAKRESVVIHPFSGSARKNWPLDRFRELGVRLSSQVDWTAGPEELLPEATRFPDLWSLAEWIAGARLYIGNDSGITHLAAATGVPTLALFGPTDPKTWAPRGENVIVLRSEPLQNLAVDEVWQAANRLLGLP